MQPPALAEWFATDYLHGDRFAALADIRIGDSESIPAHVVNAGQILYCMTDRVDELFAEIRNRTRPCVLITHNADRNVTASLCRSKPDCVRHWFAQNVMVDRVDITPIPIGLERPAASGGRTRPEAFQAAVRENAGTQNLAYLSQSDWTNPRERIPVRWSLSWRAWVTARRDPAPFEQYLHELARHQSVISPRGNGLDCHRTWEALYMGVIPLVDDNATTRAFARLFPIAVFSQLATLTRRKVEQGIANAVDQASAGWQEQLRFSWWAQRIWQMRHHCCSGS